MDEIKLVRPSMEYGTDIMQFREEILRAGDNDSFAGCGRICYSC